MVMLCRRKEGRGGAKYRISSIRRRHRILSGALSETPLSNSSRTKTSGVPAQPLVMQSNSQFLHWTLSPPKQGFPPLANFEFTCFQTVTHFIYFWIFLCCPPPTLLYIHYRLSIYIYIGMHRTSYIQCTRTHAMCGEKACDLTTRAILDTFIIVLLF